MVLGSILLASASPRRRRLLAWLGVPYECTSVDTPEDLDSPLAAHPDLLAIHLAEEKAIAARAELANTAAGQSTGDTLIAAFDTIVEIDGELLGKPSDAAEAAVMLSRLSGREHRVVTGVSLLWTDGGSSSSFAVTSRVNMRELSAPEVNRWLATEEPYGCAGAYNIEKHLAVVDLDQCFQNVAGLPLCHLYAHLATDARASARMCPPVERCDSARGVSCRLGPILMP